MLGLRTPSVANLSWVERYSLAMTQAWNYGIICIGNRTIHSPVKASTEIPGTVNHHIYVTNHLQSKIHHPSRYLRNCHPDYEETTSAFESQIRVGCYR